MDKMRIALTISLLAITIIGYLPANQTAAGFQTNSASAPATFSVANKVPDFYAEGTSEGYSLKISQNGGYLSIFGQPIAFLPWGYVTAQWSIGTVYIIFLANVTATDFYIGFLYLTNSTTPFILRTFQYQGGSVTTHNFVGVQYVFTRFAKTPSIAMPAIKISPEPQTSTSLSAIGSELYINGGSGRVINGSISLNVSPLRAQYFQGPDEYNELWSLLTDSLGNYYFAVFYLGNNDSNHVILEHQVRLNDYQRLDGRRFDAMWDNGLFNGRLTIKLPFPNSIVKVNGFPFQIGNVGGTSVRVPVGSVTVEAPNEIVSGANVRWRFLNWKNYGTENPLKVDIKPALDLTAEYTTQYLLVVDNGYDKAQGSGWYDESANATFTVPSSITSDNGTRRIFVRWQGDYDSMSSTGSIVMNSPKRIAATWKLQYAVTFQLVGVSPNSTANIDVNTESQVVQSSKPIMIWVDSNTEILVKVQTTQIQETTAYYNFAELRVDDHPSNSSILVTRPITVTVVYSNHVKTPSTISLKLNPTTGVGGYPVAITGSLNPVRSSSTISLFFSADQAYWEALANVTTANDGSFSYIWKPTDAGTFFVKAYWSGDSQRTPASQTLSVLVERSILPNLDGSNNISSLVEDLVGRVSGYPFASGLLEFAQSLLMLGMIIVAVLLPSSSPILGYFLGSFIVGFVFIFPVSTMVLSVRAARTHRRPSLIWLTPLATIWVVALALVLTGGALLATPLLVEASSVLLISSNTLIMPLLFSVLLARAVAG